MEGNSSGYEEQLLFILYAPFDDSQRSRQGRYLGKGNCTFSHEEIPAHEMQHEQRHQIVVHEYDDMFVQINFCCSCELH
jgi:hypothetical protein